jgi:hypothetical protein
LIKKQEKERKLSWPILSYTPALTSEKQGDRNHKEFELGASSMEDRHTIIYIITLPDIIS